MSTTLAPIIDADKANVESLKHRDERYNRIYIETHNQWAKELSNAILMGATRARVTMVKPDLVQKQAATGFSYDIVGAGLMADVTARVIKEFEEKGYTVKRPTVMDNIYEIQWA